MVPLRAGPEVHTADYQFRHAEEALKQAEHLLRAKWYMNAVASAYQVALRAAAGLMYARGVRPQTEREIRVAFAAQFISPGHSQPRFDESFRELERMRHLAEFEIDHEGTREEAERALELARGFWAEVQRIRKEVLK